MIRLRFDLGTILLENVLDPAQLPSDIRWDGRVDRWRAMGYQYRPIIEYFRRRQVPYQDDVQAYQKLSLSRRMETTPHPHQSESIAAWQAAGRRGVVVLPTGSGKSYVAEMAILATQRSTLIVAPTIDLMNQWYDLLCASFQTETGLIGGGYYEVRDLTVTTYDSAYIHMDRIGNRFGLIVFDECHHLAGETYSHAAQMSIAPFRLALTATLERSDNRHTLLDDLVGKVVYRREITELTGHYLADYCVRRLTVRMTEEEMAEYQAARSEYTGFLREKKINFQAPSDWQTFVKESCRSKKGRQAMQAYRRSKQLALSTTTKMKLLDTLLKQHLKDRILIFTNDNETVYTISKTFLIPAITHQTDTKERRDILLSFNQGLYRTLVTSKVLNEGVNIPEANVAIILSGSGSVREHVQRLGRILRKHDNKQAVLYEVISEGTVEERVSERRREHDAYRFSLK